jgi:hypothetical protein
MPPRTERNAVARARKRHELRRVPKDRGKLLRGQPFFITATPEKRIGRGILIVMFFAATVALICLGEQSLDIRRGEKANRDYRARASFTIEDLEATRQAGLKAELEARRAYTNDSTKLHGQAQEIINFLKQAAADPASAAATGAAQSWGLDDNSDGRELELLAEALRPPRLSNLETQLKEFFSRLEQRGIWTRSAREEESNRAGINVARPGEEPQARIYTDPYTLEEFDLYLSTLKELREAQP